MELIRLASTDHNAVIEDVQEFLPLWEQGEAVVYYDSDNQPIMPVGSKMHKSGNIFRVRPIPDRVLEDAEYDENGVQVKAAVMAGELRVDISVPDWFIVPELTTQVEPETPDIVYE